MVSNCMFRFGYLHSKIKLTECAHTGAVWETFDNTELSLKETQIKIMCSPEPENNGVKRLRVATP